MYHWDIPQVLHYVGNFDNDNIVEYAADYADVLFSLFGDRVKTWITFNEPLTFCAYYPRLSLDFGGLLPSGVTEYLCTHNVIRAHARIYRLYELKYKNSQQGEQNDVIIFLLIQLLQILSTDECIIVHT